MRSRGLALKLFLPLLVVIPIIIAVLFGIPEVALPSDWADSQNIIGNGLVVNIIATILLLGWLASLALLLVQTVQRRKRKEAEHVDTYGEDYAFDHPAPPSGEEGTEHADDDEPWYRQSGPIFEEQFTDHFPRVTPEPGDDPDTSLWQEGIGQPEAAPPPGMGFDPTPGMSAPLGTPPGMGAPLGTPPPIPGIGFDPAPPMGAPLGTPPGMGAPGETPPPIPGIGTEPPLGMGAPGEAPPAGFPGIPSMSPGMGAPGATSMPEAEPVEEAGAPTASDDTPMIVPIRAYYFSRPQDTLRSIAAQFLSTPTRWEELRSLNAASPGVSTLGPDSLLAPGTALALPGDPLPWGKPDPVYLWTLAEKFLFTAWGREPTPDEVVPFWRGLTRGSQLGPGTAAEALMGGEPAEAWAQPAPLQPPSAPPAAAPPAPAPPEPMVAPPPAAAPPTPAPPEPMVAPPPVAAPPAPPVAAPPVPAPPVVEPPAPPAPPEAPIAEPPVAEPPAAPTPEPPAPAAPPVAPPVAEPPVAEPPAPPVAEPPVAEPEAPPAPTEPAPEAPIAEAPIAEPPVDELTELPPIAEEPPLATPPTEADYALVEPVEDDLAADLPPLPTFEPTPEPPAPEPPAPEAPPVPDFPPPPTFEPPPPEAPAPPVPDFPPAPAPEPPAPEAPPVPDFPPPPTFEPPPPAFPPITEPPIEAPPPAFPPIAEPPPYQPPYQPPTAFEPPTFPPTTFEPTPSFPPPAFEPDYQPPEPSLLPPPTPQFPDLGPIEDTGYVEAEAPPMPSFMPSLTGAEVSVTVPEAQVVAASNRTFAGTAIGDAMMLWQLSRLRRRQPASLQHLNDPLEGALRENARTDALNLIDAAMRQLRAVTVGQLREKPSVLAVRVGAYGFEVLLGRPVAAPPGWQSGAGGYVLELPQGTSVEDLATREPGPSLCPALIPVGDTIEGPLLLNIEEIKCLIVSGPATPSTNLLNAIVGTLGSSPLAGDIRIITVGIDTPTGVIGWERVHSTSFDSPQLEELLTSAQAGGGGASLDVLVVGPGNDLLIQRAGQVAAGPASRLALVGATSSVAARWPWRIHVDDSTTAVVHPIACTMAAAQATTPAMAQLMGDGLAGDPTLPPPI